MRYEIPSIGTTFDRSEAVPQEGPVNLRILCESSHGILVEVMGATKTVLPWQYYDIVANKEPVKITPIDGYDSAIRTYKVTRIIYPNSIDYLTDESDILCSTVGLEDIENLNEKINQTKSDLETEINVVNVTLSNEIGSVKSELQGNINTVENNLQQVNTSLSSEINQTKADLKAEINTVNTSLSSEIDSVESGLATANSNIATNKSAIATLSLDKLNRGTLWLDGGTATTSALSIPDTFSLCTTLGANFAGSFTLGNITFTASENTLTVADGSATMTAALSATKEQTLVFIQTQSATKLYIDGVLSANGTLTFTSGAFSISGGVGQISCINAFNFDMSAENAPYTIEEYKSGKPIKPSILKARLYNADPNMGASTDGGWSNASGTKGDWTFHKGTASYEGKHLVTVNLDETDTAEVGASYAIDFSTMENLNYAGTRVRFYNNKIKLDDYAGKKIKVHISFYAKKLSALGHLSVSYDRTAYNSKAIKVYSLSNFNPDTWTKIDDIIEFTVDSGTFKGKSVGLFAAEGTDTDIGAYRIANFKFEVLGTALLAFENYTFNGEILDISGNANHATVTGNVKGTNDSSIEVLYQKIASRVSNVTVE